MSKKTTRPGLRATARDRARAVAQYQGASTTIAGKRQPHTHDLEWVKGRQRCKTCPHVEKRLSKQQLMDGITADGTVTVEELAGILHDDFNDPTQPTYEEMRRAVRNANTEGGMQGWWRDAPREKMMRFSLDALVDGVKYEADHPAHMCNKLNLLDLDMLKVVAKSYLLPVRYATPKERLVWALVAYSDTSLETFVRADRVRDYLTPGTVAQWKLDYEQPREANIPDPEPYSVIAANAKLIDDPQIVEFNNDYNDVMAREQKDWRSARTDVGSDDMPPVPDVAAPSRLLVDDYTNDKAGKKRDVLVALVKGLNEHCGFSFHITTKTTKVQLLQYMAEARAAVGLPTSAPQ